MPLLDLLLTSLIISVFCCGLFLITEPGMLLAFLKTPLTKLEKYLVLVKRKDLDNVRHSFKLNFILDSDKCQFEGSITPELNKNESEKIFREGIGKCEVNFDFPEIQKETTLTLNTSDDFKGPIENVVLIETYKRPWTILFIVPYLFKPIILCCTCMSSFWGAIVFIVLHGFTLSHIPHIIICCIMSAFLNAYFINKYYHS